MTPDQIAEVRALALGLVALNPLWFEGRRQRFNGPIIEAYGEDEVLYIVAASPQTVLAILDRLDAAERQVATLRAALEEERDTTHEKAEIVYDLDSQGSPECLSCIEPWPCEATKRINAALAPQPASGDVAPERSHGATGVSVSTDMSAEFARRVVNPEGATGDGER